MRRPLALVVLLAAGLSPEASGLAARAEDATATLLVDGRERTYHLHRPDTAGTKPLPLVFVLHGGGGTAANMDRLTQGGWKALADREGVLLVYPEGVERRWNDGRRGTGWRAHEEEIDDIGFLAALLAHLTERYPVDPKRVFATGISNGGMMSLRLACELSEKFAAVAAVTAALPADLAERCRPAAPISVLVMNGTDDPLVPYAGGEVGFGARRLGKVWSTTDTLRFWAKHDQCPESRAVERLPDRDPKDQTRVRRETFSPCRAGTEVVLVAVEGGGHTWPGGRQYLPELLIGKTSRDLDATQAIWEFFSRHRKQ